VVRDDDDSAGAQDSAPRDREVGTIGQPQNHAMTRLDPQSGQPGRHSRRLIMSVARTPDPATHNERIELAQGLPVAVRAQHCVHRPFPRLKPIRPKVLFWH
jgi:hypothetical protein